MMQRHNRQGRRWHRLLAGGTIAGILLLGGCSEEPTEANSPVANLPLAGFTTRDTTLPAIQGKFLRQYSTMEGAVNLIGRNGTYDAITVLQFSSTAFPARDTIAVYGATLRLQGITWYGTPGAPFDFTVHRINRAWSSYTLTWDTVQAGFYESTSRGTYSGSLTGDTAGITVSLDTAMVREWFATSTTSTTTKFGIVLVPGTATQNAVRGLAAFDVADSTSYFPTLTVIAGSARGTSRDTSVFNLGQDTFVGSDDHGTSPSAKIYVQGGVHFRSALLFDMSSIPRGAILNSAVLSLHLDPGASSISKFVTDSSLAAHTLGDTTSYTILSSQNTATFGRPVAGSTTFAFNIREAAQTWVRGPNYGVLIRVPTASEYSTPDLYVFHSVTASPDSLRPRLRILYSVKAN
jgi:hypothetical protein